MFNVFTGLNPTIIAQVNTPGDAQAIACTSAMSRLAVADGNAGLAIIDFSDPPAAFIAHQISASTLGGAARAVTIAGELAYVGTSMGKVAIVDLISGSVIESVSVGASVDDLASDGATLCVITANTLFTFDILSSPLTLLGQISAPGGSTSVVQRRRVFAGGGMAYVTTWRGYRTYDISDPAQIIAFPFSDTPQFGWKHTVANGTGLGVAAVGLNSSADGPHHVSLYDLSNPLVNDAFLVEYPTPGTARAIAIYNGLAYVADGQGGIQVLSYLPADTFGNPPSVSFTSSAKNNSIEEGALMSIVASVSDDVQIRHVELLVNGQVVQRDGSFPFQFYITAPLISQFGSTMIVTVRATDTGGNSTTAQVQTIQILPDLIPPTVVSYAPAQGSELFAGVLNFTGLFAFMSKPLNPATVHSSSVTLLWAGPDGVFGTGDDQPVPISVSLTQQNQRIVVGVTNTPVGPLQFRVNGSIVKDIAGNLLDGNGDGSAGGDFVVDLVTVSNAEKIWLNPSGGDWNDPNNWFPAGLPQVGDDVVISIPGSMPTIIHSAGSTLISSLNCDCELVLSGGNFGVVDSATVHGDIQLNGGTMDGGTWYIPSGHVTFTNNSNNRLVDVTVNGDLVFPDPNSRTRILNVILNGTALMIGSTSRMEFEGTQTFPTGTIEFAYVGNWFVSPYLSMHTAGTLTLGPSVLVRGGQGRILGTSPQMTFINQGSINADVAQRQILIETHQFTNQGTMIATPNATLVVQSVNWTNAGQISMTDGTLQLLGNWTNQGMISASGGSTTLGATASNWTNQSTVTLSNTTVTMQGTWANAGALTQSGNNATWAGSFSTAGLSGLQLQDVPQVTLTGQWDNSNSSYTFSGAEAFVVSGGAIIGGTFNPGSTDAITFTNNSNNRLVDVTINGDLVFPTTASRTRMLNVVLNGTAYLTGASARMEFEGTQTFPTGTIVFDYSGSLVGNMPYLAMHSAGTLTLGPSVLVRGGNGLVPHFFGFPMTLINQGTIEADMADREIRILAQEFINQGTLVASNAAALSVTSTNWTNEGIITIAGGKLLQLEGNWTNLGTINGSGEKVVLGATAGTWTNQGIIAFNETLLTLEGTWTNAGTLSQTGSNATWSGSFSTASLAGLQLEDVPQLTLSGQWDNSGSSYTFSGVETVSVNGAIIGGTVNPGSAGVIEFTANNNNRLVDVMINGDLVFPTTASRTRMLNVVLNGTAYLTGASARMEFEGTQTFPTGTIVFDYSGSLVGNMPYLAMHSAGTLTLGPSVLVRGGNGLVPHFFGFPMTLINQGTIEADMADREIRIHAQEFINQGTLVASNGGTATVTTTANYSASVLTGGTWNVLGPSTLQLQQGAIVANHAQILLSGEKSSFPALAQLESIGNNGALVLQDGRHFNASSAATFTNEGLLSIGEDCTFAAPAGYAQTATAALEAISPSPWQSALSAGDDVGLNGHLSVILKDECKGQFITLIGSIGGSVDGTFASASLPPSWDLSYTPTTVELGCAMGLAGASHGRRSGAGGGGDISSISTIDTLSGHEYVIAADAADAQEPGLAIGEQIEGEIAPPLDQPSFHQPLPPRMLSALGSCEGDDSYEPRWDLNSDGCINILDVHLWQSRITAAAADLGGVAGGIAEVVLVDNVLTFGEPGSSVSVFLKVFNNETPLFGYSLALRAVPLSGATGTVTANVDGTNFYPNQHLILADPNGAPLDEVFSVIQQWSSNGVFINANTADGSAVLAEFEVNDVFAEVHFDISTDASGIFTFEIGAVSALSDIGGHAVPFTFCGGRIAVDVDDDHPADLNGDGVVGVADLLILLANWGTCANPLACPADLNCDGVVGVADLLILLANWG